MIEYPIVLVEWDDSVWLVGWNDDDELTTWLAKHHGGTRISTVGYLLKDEAQRVVLAMGYSETEQHGSLFMIPRGCIKKITPLLPKQDGPTITYITPTTPDAKHDWCGLYPPGQSQYTDPQEFTICHMPLDHYGPHSWQCPVVNCDIGPLAFCRMKAGHSHGHDFSDYTAEVLS